MLSLNLSLFEVLSRLAWVRRLGERHGEGSRLHGAPQVRPARRRGSGAPPDFPTVGLQRGPSQTPWSASVSQGRGIPRGEHWGAKGEAHCLQESTFTSFFGIPL